MERRARCCKRKSPQDHSYRLNLLGFDPTYAKRHAVFERYTYPRKTAALITQASNCPCSISQPLLALIEFQDIVAKHFLSHVKKPIELFLVNIDSMVLPKHIAHVHKAPRVAVSNSHNHLGFAIPIKGCRKSLPGTLHQKSILHIHRRRSIMPLDRHVIVFIVVGHGFHECAQRRAPLSFRVLIPSSPVEQTVFENLFFSVHSFSLLQAFLQSAQHHLFTNLPALRSSGLTRSIAFPQNRHIVTSIGLGPSGLLSSIAARMIHSSLLAARSASSILHLVNKNFYTRLGSVRLSGPAVDHLRVVFKHDAVHAVKNRLLHVVKVRL